MGLHPNVEVRHDELMGRSIVAKEAFAPGEVIVKDEPILVWDDPVDKGYPFLLRAFNKCDKKTQGRILSMYHPALDRASPMLDLRRKKSVELCKTKECFVGSAWPGHCGWSTGTILSPQPFSQFSRFSPDI